MVPGVCQGKDKKVGSFELKTEKLGRSLPPIETQLELSNTRLISNLYRSIIHSILTDIETIILVGDSNLGNRLLRVIRWEIRFLFELKVLIFFIALRNLF
jgi:hypothetical protein